jgi:hypothetical protein
VFDEQSHEVRSLLSTMTTARAAYCTGLAVLALGFGLLLARAVLGSVNYLLFLGFLLAIASSVMLVRARCPACGQRFTGSPSQGDEAPMRKLFSPVCRYCGHKPQ